MSGSRQMPAAEIIERRKQNLSEAVNRRNRFAGMGVREPIGKRDPALLQHDLAEPYLPENVGVVDEFEAQ
jgi:hypothetical protein